MMNVPKELVIISAAAVGTLGVGYSIYQYWRRTDRKGSASNALDKQGVNREAQDVISREFEDLPDRQTHEVAQSDSNEECLYVREPGNGVMDDVETDGDIGAINSAPVVEIPSIEHVEDNEFVPNEETESETPGIDDERYDIIILNAEDDYRRAQQFKQDLDNTINIPDLSIVLYEEFAPSGQSHFRIISQVFEKCRYLFVFVTHNFTKAQLERYQQEMALMDSIQNPERQNRVIPIWAESGANDFLKELSVLQGINYHRTEVPMNAIRLRNLIHMGRQNILLP